MASPSKPSTVFRVFGEWAQLSRESVALYAHGSDLHERVFCIEVASSVFKIGGGVTSVYADELNPTSDCFKAALDMFMDVAVDMYEKIRSRPTERAEDWFMFVFSQGHDSLGRAKTNRYWIICKKSMEEMAEGQVHPGDIFKALMDRVKKMADCSGEKRKGASSRIDVSHVDLQANIAHLSGWGPLVHDGPSKSWSTTCTDEPHFRRLLSRTFDIPEQMVAMGNEMFASVFGAPVQLARSAHAGLDIGDLAGSVINNDSGHLCIHNRRLPARPDEHVYAYRSMHHLAASIRHLVLLPTVAWFKKMNMIRRAIGVMQDGGEIAVEDPMDMAEGEDESNITDAATRAFIQVSMIKQLYGDEYNVKGESSKGSKVIQINNPDSLRQFTKEAEQIVEYTEATPEETLGMTRHEFVLKRKMTALMEHFRSNNEFTSEVAKGIHLFAEERMAVRDPITRQPAHKLRGPDFQRPIRLKHSGLTSTSCLNFVIDAFEMFGIRSNHFLTSIIYFSYFDTYDPRQEHMRIHFIISGKESAGKSVMFNVVSEMLAMGNRAVCSQTASKFATFHDLGCESHESDKMFFRDDAPIKKMEAAELGREENSGDETVAMMKEGITSGKLERVIGHINEGKREIFKSVVEYRNVMMLITNHSCVKLKGTPIGSRYACPILGGKDRADGVVTDLIWNTIRRDRTESERAFQQLARGYIDFFKCMDYMMFVVMKAVGTGAIADVSLTAADDFWNRTKKYREASPSYHKGRQDRIQTRYRNLCRILTMYVRIMELYFIEGAPFWDRPLDLESQAASIEAVLVCDEQMAVFAFTLFQDEFFDTLIHDVFDAIYLFFFADESRDIFNVGGQMIATNNRKLRGGTEGAKDTSGASAGDQSDFDSEGEDANGNSKGQSLLGTQGGGPPKRRRLEVAEDRSKGFDYTIKWQKLNISKERACHQLTDVILAFMQSTTKYGFQDYKKDAVYDVIMETMNGSSTINRKDIEFNDNNNTQITMSFNECVFKARDIQVPAGVFVRGAANKMKECVSKTLASYTNATPGRYVMGTSFMFSHKLSEEGKKLFHTQKVSAVLNQYPMTVDVQARASKPESMGGGGALPPEDLMMGQFRTMGMPTDRPFRSTFKDTFSENIVSHIFKKRLSDLGHDEAWARANRIMLGPAPEGDGGAAEAYLERLNADRAGEIRHLPSDCDNDPVMRSRIQMANANLKNA